MHGMYLPGHNRCGYNCKRAFRIVYDGVLGVVDERSRDQTVCECCRMHLCLTVRIQEDDMPVIVILARFRCEFLGENSLYSTIGDSRLWYLVCSLSSYGIEQQIRMRYTDGGATKTVDGCPLRRDCDPPII